MINDINLELHSLIEKKSKKFESFFTKQCHNERNLSHVMKVLNFSFENATPIKSELKINETNQNSSYWVKIHDKKIIFNENQLNIDFKDRNDFNLNFFKKHLSSLICFMFIDQNYFSRIINKDLTISKSDFRSGSIDFQVIDTVVCEMMFSKHHLVPLIKNKIKLSKEDIDKFSNMFQVNAYLIHNQYRLMKSILDFENSLIQHFGTPSTNDHHENSDNGFISQIVNDITEPVIDMACLVVGMNKNKKR